jgi:unsaturated rhamnogalacturonyl hydrolase
VKQSPETNNTSSGPQGLLLEGMHAAWYNSANGAYFSYEKKALDAYLQRAGKPDAITLQDSWDAGLLGNEFLLMYEVTRDRAYYDAATSLDSRLASACNTNSSASPCMAEPFLAAYATAFQHDSELSAIANQFLHWQRWLQARANEKQDEAAKQSSAIMQARLLTALADALANFRLDTVDEHSLLNIFRAESAPSRLRDSGPASAQLLHVYALLKGARLGYLPASASLRAKNEWKKQVDQRLQPDAGNGALLLATTEMDFAQSDALGHGQSALLDAWFNSQQRKNAAGQTEYFHYKWQDHSDSGYSLLGHIFRGYGVSTGMLPSAPTQEDLTSAQYYIIVSPDNPAKNPNPHYMNEQDAEEVAAWVKKGGVLVMLENDPPNADIAHFNLLADKFGIHFDDVLHHHVINDKVRGDHIEDGAIPIAIGGPIFHEAHTIYTKDTCAISLSGSAQSLLKDRGDVMMATARYGKGMVFAMVDPWAYNEYTDGRKSSGVYSQFDNFAAATELVRWLIEERNGLATHTKAGVK